MRYAYLTVRVDLADHSFVQTTEQAKVLLEQMIHNDPRTSTNNIRVMVDHARTAVSGSIDESLSEMEGVNTVQEYFRRDMDLTERLRARRTSDPRTEFSTEEVADWKATEPKDHGISDWTPADEDVVDDEYISRRERNIFDDPVL